MTDNPVVGLYAGTFDPVTNGHVDIIKRAAKLVDTLYVLVADNPEKKPLFGPRQRVEMMKIATQDIQSKAEILVDDYKGLTIHAALDRGVDVLLRGMRPVGDFEHEFNIQSINRMLMPDLETVWLMSNPLLQSVSSSMVKELARHGGDVTNYVAPHVNTILRDYYPVHTLYTEGFKTHG